MKKCVNRDNSVLGWAWAEPYNCAHLCRRFLKENVLISAHNTNPFTNRIAKKRKLRRNSKLVIIFFKTLGDPFVAVAEAASQSSSDAKAKLYKVKAAEEGLLLGEPAKYTASQLHRSNPAPTTQHFFPTPAT
jgi:hypothetical protein